MIIIESILTLVNDIDCLECKNNVNPTPLPAQKNLKKLGISFIYRDLCIEN